MKLVTFGPIAHETAPGGAGPDVTAVYDPVHVYTPVYDPCSGYACSWGKKCVLQRGNPTCVANYNPGFPYIVDHASPIWYGFLFFDVADAGRSAATTATSTTISPIQRCTFGDLSSASFSMTALMALVPASCSSTLSPAEKQTHHMTITNSAIQHVHRLEFPFIIRYFIT